jgi:hypothetical protein
MRMFRARRGFKNFLPLLLSTLMFGCGGGGSDGQSVEPTFTSLWDHLFSGCGVNCHGPDSSDGTQYGPDLTSMNSFLSNTIKQNVNNDFLAWANVKSGNCNDVNFITPGNADRSTVAASLILSISDRLAASDNCVTSFNLHEVNRVTITDKAVANALVNWINNGAQNN